MNTTTPQGIDRDELTPEEAIEDLRTMVHAWDTSHDPAYYDERPYGAGVEDTWNRVKSILALVRPVEGVTANLSESASEGDRRARVGHNHVTRDIKPEGQCPACDAYHLATRAQEARSAAVEDGTY